jgi:hypothetical protein
MYRLLEFGTVDLPEYDFSWNAGTPASIDGAIAVIGGAAVSGFGTGDAPLAYPYNISYSGSFYAATAAALRTKLDELRAQVGKYDKLWRRAEDDNTLHWAWAKLAQLTTSNDVTHAKTRHQPVTLEFQVQSGWHGENIQEAAGNLTTETPVTIVVNNTGNAPVLDAVLTVTADDAAITSVVVVISPHCDWTYDGSIAAGEAVIVDAGAFSIKNDGTGDYANFEFGAGQTVPEWLRFDPDKISLVITITGGGTTPTATVDYYDAWR